MGDDPGDPKFAASFGRITSPNASEEQPEILLENRPEFLKANIKGTYRKSGKFEDGEASLK
jgi:hypothetical protein